MRRSSAPSTAMSIAPIPPEAARDSMRAGRRRLADLGEDRVGGRARGDDELAAIVRRERTQAHARRRGAVARLVRVRRSRPAGRDGPCGVRRDRRDDDRRVGRRRSGTRRRQRRVGLAALVGRVARHASAFRACCAEVADEAAREHHRHAHDRQLRVHADARRQDAAVDHEEVLDAQVSPVGFTTPVSRVRAHLRRAERVERHALDAAAPASLFSTRTSSSFGYLIVPIPKIGRSTSRAPAANAISPRMSDRLEEALLVAADHPVGDERLAREPAPHLAAAVVVDHAAEEREVRHRLHEAPVLAADARERRGEHVTAPSTRRSA